MRCSSEHCTTTTDERACTHKLLVVALGLLNLPINNNDNFGLLFRVVQEKTEGADSALEPKEMQGQICG